MTTLASIAFLVSALMYPACAEAATSQSNVFRRTSFFFFSFCQDILPAQRGVKRKAGGRPPMRRDAGTGVISGGGVTRAGAEDGGDASVGVRARDLQPSCCRGRFSTFAYSCDWTFFFFFFFFFPAFGTVA